MAHELEVIDCQLHEVGVKSDVPVDDPAMRNRLILEVTLSAMDAVGVDAALLFPLDDAFADFAIAEFPDRFASIPMIRDPSVVGLDDRIARLRESPGILGLRVIGMWSRTDADPPRDPQLFEPIFAAAERHDVPVFLFVGGNLERAVPVLEAHPDLTVIIDHLGLRQPPLEQRDDPPFRRLPDLLALARFPNVAVKVCGVPALSEEQYPFTDAWPFVHQMFEAFGPERLMWASDIPRFQGKIGFEPWFTRDDFAGKHTYAESLDFFRNTSELSPSEKELLLGQNLRRILRWE